MRAILHIPRSRGALALGLLALTALALTACATAGDSPTTAVPGGNAALGKQAITMYGCGACHTIPGVPGARGNVGPPLAGIAGRMVIAGKLQNEPDNMIVWIQHPQSVWPGNAMPEMGVTDADARNIAAYLYTLK